MIALDFKASNPLHQQIRNGIIKLIMSGTLKQDEQLPSVRELSVMLTVNPNTVQRAYKDMEKDGFIYSVLGRGCFVSAVPKINQDKIESLYLSLEETIRELIFWGESKEDILKRLELK